MENSLWNMGTANSVREKCQPILAPNSPNFLVFSPNLDFQHRWYGMFPVHTFIPTECWYPSDSSPEFSCIFPKFRFSRKFDIWSGGIQHQLVWDFPLPTFIPTGCRCYEPVLNSFGPFFEQCDMWWFNILLIPLPIPIFLVTKSILMQQVYSY